MNAQKARELAEESAPKEDAQLQFVLKKVKQSAEQNGFNVLLEGEWLSQKTMELLSELGYQFKNDSSGNNAYCIIYW